MAADLVVDSLAAIRDDASRGPEALEAAIETQCPGARGGSGVGARTMGATVVALFIQGGIAHGWAGDSRAYLMRGAGSGC